MDKVKISIIIPVYNAEEYLDRCLYSILDQEFTYTVLEEADVKECASVLKLIFPLTDGQNLTICCQCMKSDTYY